MARYTERLDIKMTPEDMALLAAGALGHGLPLTVYARELIINQLNPLLGGDNDTRYMERYIPNKLETRGET